jgi:hypothetical protein
MSDIGLSQGDLDHDGLYGNLSSKTSTRITSLGQIRESSPNLSLRRSTTNSIVISGHDFALPPLSLLEKASLLLCSLLCYMARCSIALVCRGWKYCWPPGIIGLVLLYTLYRAPKFSKLLGLLTCLLFSRQEQFAFHCLVSASLPITPGLDSPHELFLESLTKLKQTWPFSQSMNCGSGSQYLHFQVFN